MIYSFFSCNDPATSEIYTLSLHDALPILQGAPKHAEFSDWRDEFYAAALIRGGERSWISAAVSRSMTFIKRLTAAERSEEHTSELQSRVDLVCRLLLEKKKKTTKKKITKR